LLTEARERAEESYALAAKRCSPGWKLANNTEGTLHLRHIDKPRKLARL